jgi:enoyl-CoA hydratase/carnithine racemase
MAEPYVLSACPAEDGGRVCAMVERPACRVDRRGDVFVLTMCHGDNRFDPTMVEELGAALDRIEASSGRAALVTTGEDKIFSNGLALEWMLRGAEEGDPDRSRRSLEGVYALLARFLTFPMPTVAAVNGHWFGAGALLGLVHDRRVARAERGWFCMPEATMGLGIALPLMEVLRATLPLRALREICVTAQRVTATEAVDLGFVAEAADGAHVLERAITWAEAHASADRTAIADIKATMYGPTLAVLRGDASGSRAHRPASGRGEPA